MVTLAAPVGDDADGAFLRAFAEAAGLFEAAADDVALVDGRFGVAGVPDTTLSWAQVATHAEESGAPLDVGTDYVVGLRMSGDELLDNGLTHEDCITIARTYAERGLIDFVNGGTKSCNCTPEEKTGSRKQNASPASRSTR